MTYLTHWLPIYLSVCLVCFDTMETHMVTWKPTWCHGNPRGAMETHVVPWDSRGTMEAHVVPWRPTWYHEDSRGTMETHVVPWRPNGTMETQWYHGNPHGTMETQWYHGNPHVVLCRPNHKDHSQSHPLHTTHSPLVLTTTH